MVLVEKPLAPTESVATGVQVLQAALERKPLEHQFRNNYTPCRPMTAIGG